MDNRAVLDGAAVAWLTVDDHLTGAVLLRALRADRHARPVLAPDAEALIHRFAAEHDDLQDILEAVRNAADLLCAGCGPQALTAVAEAHRLLTERLLPHEYAEEHELYPALAPVLGGPEATATMSRAHTEIERLARRIATHLELVGDGGRPRNSSTTCGPVSTASTPSCACTSRRRRRTISPSLNEPGGGDGRP